jgi:PAS domain S-box-containing protein
MNVPILEIATEILDELPIGIFWQDTNLTYLGCNKYHADKAGVEKTEIIGKKDSDLRWIELTDSADFELSSMTTEEILIVKQDEQIWCKITKIPLKENNQTKGVLCLWQDITEMADILDTLADALNQANAAAKIINRKIA